MMNYETVCGIEVHTELATATKIFCSCTTAFSGEANTHCCEICLGMPGTLPVLNEKVVEFAVRTGLALHCEITYRNRFDRKNYFYPDLPKAYQISQLYLPICRNGYVEIDDSINGGKKKIRIHEIHMEEDAGKLIHDESGKVTYVNYNRAGVPLLEIVSEPDLSNGEEAMQYTKKLREILRFIGVSDCKMQEGSLRADVNVSVRKHGTTKLGTRCEMKNISSLKAIKQAVDVEAKRQTALIESGNTILPQTRRWDEKKNISYAMREKEETQDYKYFPEPDLPWLILSEAYIKTIADHMPELPDSKKQRYLEEYHLSEYDADLLLSDTAYCRLFEETVSVTHDPKASVNWITGEVMMLLKESGTPPEKMTLSGEKLGEILRLISENMITRETGKEVLSKVFYEGVDPFAYIKEHSLEIQNNSDVIVEVVRQIIMKNPKAVNEYCSGKEKAIGFLIGQAMKQLKGSASPVIVKNEFLRVLNS